MADFDEYEYLEKAVDVEKGGVENGGEEGRRRHEEEEFEETERRVRRKGEDRDRDPGEEEGPPGRERERSRERERDEGEKGHREREHRDRDRDSHRGRDGYSRDRERGEHRGRGDREYRRNRDYDRRDYHRSRRREDKEEPEADPERDQRTVFAYQINLKADERDVYEFFSRAGKVRDVRLIMDRNSGRSKGVGYIEFYDAMSVPMAIALRGQLLLGTPVMVKPSEAEKNLAAQAAAAMPTGATAGLAGVAGMPGASLLVPSLAAGSKRLQISNLHVNMNEEQLRQVVEPFGQLDSVQVPMDPTTKQCKGFGFVTYSKIEDARIAQQYLTDMELAGLKIKVQFIPEGFSLPGAGDGAHLNPGELDDDEGGGLSLNAQSRAALMQKLDRSAVPGGAPGALAGAGLLASTPLAAAAAGILPGLPGAAALPALAGAAGLPGAASLPGLASLANPALAIGTPTAYLQLTNMFNSADELDSEFVQDIQEDVDAECSKFGQVRLVHVDRKSTGGHVYVQFESVDGAIKARQALHNRWFAGKPISATFMDAVTFQIRIGA